MSQQAPDRVGVAVELDGRAVAVIPPGQGWKASWDRVEYVRADQSDPLRAALAELVRLKDGPRDDVYRAAKDAAWQRARDVLAEAK
jgi:hypothetical protein